MPAPIASTPTKAPAAPATPKFTETQVWEAYGWYAGMKLGLNLLEFTKEQVEAMARGMVLAAADEPLPIDANEIAPEVEVFYSRKYEAFYGRKHDELTTRAQKRNHASKGAAPELSTDGTAGK